MRQSILPGTEQALLFAAEEHETNGAPRNQSGGLDRARGLDHQSGVAAIVQRASAQVPGIEMRAENDCFIGHFAAANFSYYIFLFRRTADFVGHAEAHTHFAGVGGYCSRQPHGIFARDHCLGNPLQCSVASVGVAIEQEVLACTHPENRGSASLYGALDYAWGLRVLAKEIGPLCA